MSVGLAPVDIAAAISCVDSHIHRAVCRDAMPDSGRAEALKNGIKLLVPDAKAVVMDWNVFLRFNEVERQPIINVDI